MLIGFPKTTVETDDILFNIKAAETFYDEAVDLKRLLLCNMGHNMTIGHIPFSLDSVVCSGQFNYVKKKCIVYNSFSDKRRERKKYKRVKYKKTV